MSEKKEKKQYTIIKNNKEIEELFKHIFYFKKAKEILAIDRKTLKPFSIPNESVLIIFVKENFDCVHKEDENSYREELTEREFKTFFKKIELELIKRNQFDIFQYSRDPFAKNPKIIKDDNKLHYIAPSLYIKKFNEKIQVNDSTRDEIIQDYLKHFEELPKIIKWIVACRFNEARRSSFTYLRIKAGFGKSFFLSILEDLGIAVTVKHTQIKENSASDLSPALFRNAFVMAIDEFTHFQQELKSMTNEMSLSAKFQLSERVPLYAKLLLSAEKSTSFFGDAGVDSQIAERTNIIDKSNATALNKREVFKRDKKTYYEVVKKYIYDLIVNEVEKYLNLGEVEANKEADKLMTNFHNIYTIKADTIEKIQEKIFATIIEFADWLKEPLTERQFDSFFQSLQTVAILKNDNEIVVKNLVKFYELLIKAQGEQFAKVARFKQTALEEIFELRSLSSRVFKIQKKSIRGILLNISKLEQKFKESVVQVNVKDKNGNIIERKDIVVKNINLDDDEEINF